MGLILLGNIYAKHKKDDDAAEVFYQKAYQLDPKDPYLLNNYASLKVNKDQTDEAAKMFNQAITIDPTYPNSWFGLASLYSSKGEKTQALETLQKFFSKASSEDPRSKPVFEQARRLYSKLNREIAEENYESFIAFIHTRANIVESVTGIPVEDERG